jgi:hypothetical protein
VGIKYVYMHGIYVNAWIPHAYGCKIWKYSSLCVQSEFNKGVLEHFVVVGWSVCLMGESALRMGKW